MEEDLLKVKQVAKKLNISPRTVYKRQKELGGFKPVGGCLRFDPEVIDGIVLGPRAETLAIPIQTQRDKIYRQRILDKERFRRGGGGRKKETFALVVRIVTSESRVAV